MLSNITSYLFGGQTSNSVSEKENVNFHEVEEDDWMLIDKLGDLNKSSDGDDLIVSSETFISDVPALPITHINPPVVADKASRRRSISCKRLANRRCSTPLREISPVWAYPIVPQIPKKGSNSSSKSSLNGLEESWYVTPPPCFVAPPYETKPSSLENLLIEQPGMVQNFSSSRRQLMHRMCDEQHVRLSDEQHARLSDEHHVQLSDMQKLAAIAAKKREEAKACNRTTASCTTSRLPEENKRRQDLLEMHEQKKLVNLYHAQLSAMQKDEQKLSCQFTKRNQMERMNKVQHELSSRKKRQRRADLTNRKHSGVNNNRKCCY